MTIESARALLAEAKELSEKATPGPWTFGEENGITKKRYQGALFTENPRDKRVAHEHFIFADEDTRGSDARFIRDARSLVPKLTQALTAVLDLCDKIAKEPDAGHDHSMGVMFAVDSVCMTIAAALEGNHD